MNTENPSSSSQSSQNLWSTEFNKTYKIKISMSSSFFEGLQKRLTEACSDLKRLDSDFRPRVLFDAQEKSIEIGLAYHDFYDLLPESDRSLFPSPLALQFQTPSAQTGWEISAARKGPVEVLALVSGHRLLSAEKRLLVEAFPIKIDSNALQKSENSKRIPGTAHTKDNFIESLIKTDSPLRLVLGEQHSNTTARDMLIQSMPLLKGKILAVEGLYFESHQQLLDQWILHAGADTPLPLELIKAGARTGLQPLLIEAKKHGVRVLAVDTESLNNTTDAARAVGMNYLAQKIIEQEVGNKDFIALVGAAHATDYTPLTDTDAKKIVGLGSLIKDATSAIVLNNQKHQEIITHQDITISRGDNTKVGLLHDVTVICADQNNQTTDSHHKYSFENTIQTHLNKPKLISKTTSELLVFPKVVRKPGGDRLSESNAQDVAQRADSLFLKRPPESKSQTISEASLAKSQLSQSSSLYSLKSTGSLDTEFITAYRIQIDEAAQSLSSDAINGAYVLRTYNDFKSHLVQSCSDLAYNNPDFIAYIRFNDAEKIIEIGHTYNNFRHDLSSTLFANLPSLSELKILGPEEPLAQKGNIKILGPISDQMLTSTTDLHEFCYLPTHEQFNNAVDANGKMPIKPPSSFRLESNSNILNLIPNLINDAKQKADHFRLILGEQHSNATARSMIMKAMPYLKGKTLAIEGLFYDTQQRLLDKWVKSPRSTPLPYELRDLRPEIKDLLLSAKNNDVRILAIDLEILHPLNGQRIERMNYIAKEIIDHEVGRGDFIALVGANHGADYRFQGGGKTEKLSPGLRSIIDNSFSAIVLTLEKTEKKNIFTNTAASRMIQEIQEHLSEESLSPSPRSLVLESDIIVKATHANEGDSPKFQIESKPLLHRTLSILNMNGKEYRSDNTEQQSTDKSHVDSITTDQNSAEQTPVDSITTEQHSAEQTPVDSITTEQHSAEQTPVQLETTEQHSAEQTPVQLETTEQHSAEQTPVQLETTEQHSAEQTPVDSITTEQHSAEQTPVDSITTEQHSAEQTPVQLETTDQMQESGHTNTDLHNRKTSRYTHPSKSFSIELANGKLQKGLTALGLAGGVNSIYRGNIVNGVLSITESATDITGIVAQTLTTNRALGKAASDGSQAAKLTMNVGKHFAKASSVAGAGFSLLGMASDAKDIYDSAQNNDALGVIKGVSNLILDTGLLICSFIPGPGTAVAMGLVGTRLFASGLLDQISDPEAYRKTWSILSNGDATIFEKIVATPIGAAQFIWKYTPAGEFSEYIHETNRETGIPQLEFLETAKAEMFFEISEKEGSHIIDFTQGILSQHAGFLKMKIQDSGINIALVSSKKKMIDTRTTYVSKNPNNGETIFSHQETASQSNISYTKELKNITPEAVIFVQMGHGATYEYTTKKTYVMKAPRPTEKVENVTLSSLSLSSEYNAEETSASVVFIAPKENPYTVRESVKDQKLGKHQNSFSYVIYGGKNENTYMLGQQNATVFCGSGKNLLQTSFHADQARTLSLKKFRDDGSCILEFKDLHMSADILQASTALHSEGFLHLQIGQTKMIFEKFISLDKMFIRTEDSLLAFDTSAIMKDETKTSYHFIDTINSTYIGYKNLWLKDPMQHLNTLNSVSGISNFLNELMEKTPSYRGIKGKAFYAELKKLSEYLQEETQNLSQKGIGMGAEAMRTLLAKNSFPKRGTSCDIDFSKSTIKALIQRSEKPVYNCYTREQLEKLTENFIKTLKEKVYTFLSTNLTFDNTYKGTKGQDIFVLNQKECSALQIIDFDDTNDRLKIADIQSGSDAQSIINHKARQDKDDIIIDFDSQNSLTLKNMQLAQLTVDDFFLGNI